MLRSMTGFGKGEHRYAGGKVSAELKSVNHRFYDLSARLPAHILFLEDKIRAYINKKVRRGRVSLALSIEGRQAPEKLVIINKELIKKYYKALAELKNQLKLKAEPSLEQLLALPDAITFRQAQVNTEKLWLRISAALDKALNQLVKTREKEGAALAKDLLSRIKAIETLLGRIKLDAPQAAVNYRNAFLAKLKNISSSVNLEPGRLETEAAIFAKNCDISEEITRSASHIKSFKDVISGAAEAGRQLDFIAQEFFREFNTMGSKAQDVKVAKLVIQAKEQIEKIREQVQNVE